MTARGRIHHPGDEPQPAEPQLDSPHLAVLHTLDGYISRDAVPSTWFWRTVSDSMHGLVAALRQAQDAESYWREAANATQAQVDMLRAENERLREQLVGGDAKASR